MSHTSNTPSVLTVKKTEGLTGLQQPSIRYDIWYLERGGQMLRIGSGGTREKKRGFERGQMGNGMIKQTKLNKMRLK